MKYIFSKHCLHNYLKYVYTCFGDTLYTESNYLKSSKDMFSLCDSILPWHSS